MRPKKTQYSYYNLNYHLVWIPKYRRKILVRELATKLEQYLRETAENNRCEVISLKVQPDYVHLFVSAPPRFSPAQLINLFKGYTSRKLREDFPELKEIHPEKLWTRTYYAETAGGISEEAIQYYLENCED